MPYSGYYLLFLALAAFFAAITWFFVRIACSTEQKQEFLASSLCCAGSGIASGFFLMIALLPIDQYGSTHEPDWTDALVPIGFAALGAGHLVKSWRTPFFL